MDDGWMIVLEEGKECCEVDLVDIRVIEGDVGVESGGLGREFEVCDGWKEMVCLVRGKEEGVKVG